MRIKIFYGAAGRVEDEANKWLVANGKDITVHFGLQSQSTPDNLPKGTPLAFWLVLSIFYTPTGNGSKN